MLLKETLRQVAMSQMGDLKLFEPGVERERLRGVDLGMPYALVLSGVRRCGKSTLLRQLMKRAAGFYYFNFEDTRVAGFEAADFYRLDGVLHDEFGDHGLYFFDEIQNVGKWELFVRSGLDRKKRFVIAGSNASLLSRELGTRLTGRHLGVELFPFSFSEMLLLQGEKPGPGSFQSYLLKGGFPEYLKHGNPEALRELFNDIIERDIVVRHGLRDSKAMKEMALYLLSNISREFSYNSLKKIFGLGSVNTVISFLSYLEDSYLLFSVQRFDYSLKKRLIYPKKVYSIDNGLSAANTVSFSSDRGRMLENAVFLHLRRRHKGIFYFKGSGECDFLVYEKNKIVSVVQVCYGLNEENKEREIGGLLEAAGRFGLDTGLILTLDQEDEFTSDGRKIVVKPVWKWMLE